MTPAERLEIAEHLCRLIVRARGEAVLGVSIYGSTARGADGPRSDLEMKVLLADGDAHDVEYVHVSGLKVELNYQPFDDYVDSVLRVTPDWPLCAAEHRGRRVLFERDGAFAAAEAAAGTPDDGDFAAAQVEVVAQELFEEMGKLRSAHDRGDADAVRAAAHHLAWTAAMWLALENRTPFRTGGTVWAEAAAFAILPDGWATDHRVLAGLDWASADDVRAAAERVWGGIEAIAEARGIAWQSEDWRV